MRLINGCFPSWWRYCTWYRDHRSHFQIDIHVLSQHCVIPSNGGGENSVNVSFSIQALIQTYVMELGTMFKFCSNYRLGKNNVSYADMWARLSGLLDHNDFLKDQLSWSKFFEMQILAIFGHGSLCGVYYVENSFPGILPVSLCTFLTLQMLPLAKTIPSLYHVKCLKH